MKTLDWRGLLARLPLPMLALAASYGVFSFQSLFSPWWVALISAAAFELVYVGLAVARLEDGHRRRARAISAGAVITSIAYNTLSALLHIRPALLVGRPLWADVVLALLHGAPLAWLAWLVADLLLHSDSAPTQHDTAPTAPSQSATPVSVTVDARTQIVAADVTPSPAPRDERPEVVKLVDDSGMTITAAAQQLSISRQTASRLYNGAKKGGAA